MLTDSKAYNGFAVDDIGKARDFYGETLGLKTDVLDEQNGLLSLHLAGGATRSCTRSRTSSRPPTRS